MTFEHPDLRGHRPAMTGTCGFDPDDRGECGRPAVLHGWVGDPTPPVEPGYTLTACPDHVHIVKAIAVDWHDHGSACDVPGAVWQFGDGVGAGFCFWPAAEDALAAEVAELEGVRA